MLEFTRRMTLSRPRRFGKSMAANMLTAYYSRGCDSRELFSGLKIRGEDDFEKHLNKYNVIRVNIVNFLGQKTINEMIDYLSRRLLHELKKAFSDVDCFDWEDLNSVLEEICDEKHEPFRLKSFVNNTICHLMKPDVGMMDII